MKITMEKAALLRPLAHLHNVVERRNTLPILSNIMLETKDGQVRMTATDMDMDMVEVAGATIEAEGGITTLAHTLHDIVRKLPDGAEITLETDSQGKQASIRAARSQFTLPLLPVADFPKISSEDMPVKFSLAAADLRAILHMTKDSTSSEESRYYLMGIYLHKTDDGLLRAVATDGHRLALTQIPLPKGAEKMPSAIIPRKAYEQIIKLMEEHSDDVEISVSENRIRFVLGAMVITSRLIDGTFPDYERVVPRDNQLKAVVATKAFHDAVDRVSTVASEKSRTVELLFGKDSLTISAHGQDQASGSEVIETSWSGSEDLKIGFNSRYLMDIAALIKGDSVEFSFAEPSNPSLIRAVDDDSSLFVVMPVRV